MLQVQQDRTCKGCACVKAGLPCTSCLPSRLGSCVNSQQTQTQTARTPVNALPAAQLSDVPPTTETTEEDSPADGDSHDDLLAPPQPPGVPDATIQELPCPSPMAEAHFTWGPWGPWEVSSEQYINSVKVAYSEVVHWRRNIFSVPSGKAGRAFVREMARLFRSYAEGSSSLESIAITAAMILPPLLLQKPTLKSKAREHASCLERRFQCWRAGDIESLLNEGRTIQSRLPKAPLHAIN